MVVSRGRQLAAMDLNPEGSLMCWEVSSILNVELESCSVYGWFCSLTLPVNVEVDV